MLLLFVIWVLEITYFHLLLFAFSFFYIHLCLWFFNYQIWFIGLSKLGPVTSDSLLLHLHLVVLVMNYGYAESSDLLAVGGSDSSSLKFWFSILDHPLKVVCNRKIVQWIGSNIVVWICYLEYFPEPIPFVGWLYEAIGSGVPKLGMYLCNRITFFRYCGSLASLQNRCFSRPNFTIISKGQ